MHRLEEMTDQGFHLKKVDVQSETVKQGVLLGSHRDDHYLFFLGLTGMGSVMVDFEEFTLEANTLFYILPGQMHSYRGSDAAATGWFMALDPGLVPDSFRAVLENPLLSIKPVAVMPAELEPMLQCLELMDTLQRRLDPCYSRQAVYHMLSAFTAMFTDVYARQQCIPADKVSRSQTIMLEFRKLLSVEYKQLKSAGEYAAALHLSLSYLNEAVKDTTGFTVSYWIQQQIVLEAKRLLYYSQYSVKEIAHRLGYEDHTYFSRLFKKTVGRTPLEFRGLYR
ncbi:transcriptional regulator [Puia dinghuensis]|uniref:Transcriptional regulator n=2 Tax=Puia dinghuensis TaxID=1792502 RepID=A0A8J2UBD6_9BACT|nr:transcriptional regulator [Puia dinghuensis]